MKNICYTPIDLRENDRREINTQINNYLRRGGQIENVENFRLDVRPVRKAAVITQFQTFED